MQLVQSFISIAETAAKQETRPLKTTANTETQQGSKQLSLNGKFHRLI